MKIRMKLTDAEAFAWLERMRKKARRKQGMDGGKKSPDILWREYWAGREYAYEEFLRKFTVSPDKPRET